ncbi:MAG: SDR family NAD(P)-dependent oxidoreductase [Deltaproteobacteria bacterium]|nr:SDR family NAD(P)-dependent oxidoreductase [Deltaproteobacteria bacterium]
MLSKLLAPWGIASVERLRRAVEGKRVLVTGASFGIGEALALRLGAAGARVILAARSEEQLQALAVRIGNAEVLPLDLMDSAQIEKAAEKLNAGGPVDVVIHNAGKSIRRLLLDSLERNHDFQRTMAVNYLGPVQLQLALLPAMLARGGHIVNVSSLGVRMPPAPRWAAYTASKAAFDVWIRSVAPELKGRGIACTSIYFGLVHTRMSAPTEMYRTMPGQTPDEAAQVVCRALINKPRAIAPWWVRPVRWFLPPLEGVVAWALGLPFSRGVKP